MYIHAVHRYIYAVDDSTTNQPSGSNPRFCYVIHIYVHLSTTTSVPDRLGRNVAWLMYIHMPLTYTQSWLRVRKTGRTVVFSRTKPACPSLPSLPCFFFFFFTNFPRDPMQGNVSHPRAEHARKANRKTHRGQRRAQQARKKGAQAYWRVDQARFPSADEVAARLLSSPARAHLCRHTLVLCGAVWSLSSPRSTRSCSQHV